MLTLYGEEKELVIPLATRSFLSSVYLNSPLNKELSDVLAFDLNNNGSTYITDQETSDFRVDIEKMGKSFRAVVSLARKEMTKSFGPYRLSGNFASDRRVIHQFSDEVTALVSGKAGIASSRILYALQVPEGTQWKSEIWEADYDGKNKRQITREKSYCITPTFFPCEGAFTDNKFLYVNYKNGQPKIYISSFDKAQGTPLVSLRGNQLLPAISKKGDMMAFISDASGRADLFVQPFNRTYGPMGKPIQAFSFPRSVQASPTFRPDGKKIAFVSDKNGTPRIFLINTPSPGRRLKPRPLCITKKYRHNTCPSWSPDGTKLAYSAIVDGTRQIMVYDFLTKEEIQLTAGKSHKENPSWSPNSLHIVYNTVDPSSSELFIINLKQKESLQITSGSGKKHYPAWEPIRGPE
ncbi:Tol-Pal system protein TolB [Candidatus Neptunochlamydia vexilliferae]|uniref:Protein TolB homolog n=1 Tax=Candidatus Neptunichlamydia vexilliferae TaxID=1651774 RepID=A0ABS0AZQ5_9BACT|nr:Tol-Pal system protein TolB [Candidatus Neptunochlamydia vexilliferae]MBF5059430.1 Protein TolB [Candidatus Neptunochlamydia vexilliferae]